VKFWHATAFMDPTLSCDLARWCEEAGFHGAMVSDHVMYPEVIESKYPYAADGRPFWTPETPWMDVFVATAAMAAVTTKLWFTQNIYVFPLRHPVEVAKLAASASIMAGGRFALGAGAGWMKEEFDVLGTDYHTRGKRMDEGIEVCRKAWTGKPVSHDGTYYQFPTVTVSPTPPGGKIPVWIGGHSDAALKRAARNDGWIGNAYPLEEADAKLDQLEGYLAAQGKHLGDPGFEVIIGIYSLAPDDFKRFADRGVTGFMAAPAMLSGAHSEAKGDSSVTAARRDAVLRFGDEIIAKLP
jgi:probable F420-dependent oxidoreductase